MKKLIMIILVSIIMISCTNDTNQIAQESVGEIFLSHNWFSNSDDSYFVMEGTEFSWYMEKEVENDNVIYGEVEIYLQEEAIDYYQQQLELYYQCYGSCYDYIEGYKEGYGATDNELMLLVINNEYGIVDGERIEIGEYSIPSYYLGYLVKQEYGTYTFYFVSITSSRISSFRSE